jgi:gamma-glutamylcyclotransferase (GGCT)/AIG2-like uncharacterized protein YtfP
MKDYLFVYGTLSPDRAPPHLRDIISRMKPVAAGSMSGHVYDLGDFPGAIYDRASGSRVLGQVFELPEDIDALKRIDAYEECIPDDAKASLFVRDQRPVDLQDGTRLQCWVYLYNRDPGRSPIVPSGDYASWAATHQTSR